MMNRAIAPSYTGIEQVKLLEPQRVVLQNEIPLFIFNAGDQDLIKIEWIFENRYLPKKSPLLNIALSGMLLEGTKKHSSAEIAEQVDFYGAFLQPEYSFDYTGLTLYVLHKHVDTLLALVKEILTSTIFPEKELQTYIRNNKQSLSVSLKKNDFVARRTFNQTIFEGTPYGYSTEMGDYDRLRREDLLELYTHQIQAGNCTLFVSGKVTDSIVNSIQQQFGSGWEGPLLPEKGGLKFSSLPEQKEILIERADALQSAIRIGNRTINRAHPDFSALQLVNTIFGGYFGSHLMSNIREEKGYTYGIGSGIASLKYGAFFTIATEVGVSVTQNTLEEIEKEVYRMKNSLISEEELSLVKNYMGGSFMGSLENVFSHVDKFKNVYFIGLDLNYYRRHLEIIKNSSAEQVLETSRQYLDLEQMVQVIVGKY